MANSREMSLKAKIQNEFKENVSNEIRRKRNLFTCLNDLILYWSDMDKCILSTSITEFREDRPNYQTLLCSTAPAFDITQIKCSSSGHHVLVFGESCIAIIELPRKWGVDGLFENGKKVIHCKLTMIDESFFMHHLSTKILQVDWYQGSPNDQHIVVLTTDNSIRFYNILSPEQPLVRLPLFEQNFSETRDIGSICSIASNIIGNTAVDFDIAKAVINDDETETYHIYVMQESGDVWLLKCRFLNNRLQVDQQGPLTMNPPAQDNYGCDYCSLLCLQTSPTVIAMATRDGRIHHCIVMESDSEDDSEIFDLSNRSVDSNVALFVYEIVQLELTFINETSGNYEDNEDSETALLSNLHLVRDATNSDSYLCISDGGFHTIYTPWINDLDKFMSSDVPSSHSEIEAPAEVSYLLCTQPSVDSPCSSICGCLVLKDAAYDPYITCLLSSGDMISLNYKRGLKNAMDSFNMDNNESKDYQTSPLRKLKAVGGFDTFIAKILQKNATVPKIRSGGGNEMIPADLYYKLLTKTTQILREEYMQKMLHAKVELEKRCKLLRLKKAEQQSDIDALQKDTDLSTKGDELASKLELAQEKAYFLTARIGQVLRNLQTSSPVLSKEEVEWNKELKTMQQKLTSIKRFSEQVKVKHENMILQTVPFNPKQKKQAVAANTLSTSQSIKVRAVLKDQGELISGLVEQVQSLQLRVGPDTSVF